MKNSKIKYCLFIFFLVASGNVIFAQSTLISDMDTLSWEEVMPGIWKACFGE